MSIKSKSLLGSSLLDEGSEGGIVDPMGGMGNLMDVMLVFACGLIIALIARYNVELSPSTTATEDIAPFDVELEQVQEGIDNSDTQYAEVGTVYKDMETGDLYILTPDGSVLEE